MSHSTNKYKKTNHREHVLLRPDTYVGSVVSRKYNEYVVKGNESGKDNIVMNEVEYPEALLRIFIEILSNATDNVWRSRENKVDVKKLSIDINQETGETTVSNDGLVIPCDFSKDMPDIYTPEMVFGVLLTSSNYDDDEERKTIGRNGYGAKLTNIFSTSFSVKIYDPSRNVTYSQKWSNSMSERSPPKITKCTSKKAGYTTITWTPDFSLFKDSKGVPLTGYTPDHISLLKKYVYDAAVTTNLTQTTFNKKRVGIKGLKNYASLYSTSPSRQLIEIETPDSNVVIIPSPNSEFGAISFVNHTAIPKGVHIDKWVDTIIKPLQALLSKKLKVKLKPADLKSYLNFFVVCELVNPQFRSQMKQELTSPKPTIIFEKDELDKIIKKISGWPFVQELKEISKIRAMDSLKNTDGCKRSFVKVDGYDAANNAGKKNSGECTLILCEGLSAKTYAVSGIKVGWNGKAGRNWFGIMPLRGKLLNTRNSSPQQIEKNKEITNLKKILGLKHALDYTKQSNYETLNYGRVMILTDSDVDGIHIEGLILNMFNTLYPTLLKRDGFLVSMRTPVTRVTLKKKSELIFYNTDRYDSFMENTPLKNIKKVKYYKGLGTSNKSEVLETFGKYVIIYQHDSNSDTSISKAFSSSSSNLRKEWLTNYRGGDKISNDKPLQTPLIEDINITNFIENRLILFSFDDCKRSIPNVYSGFKESQTKILFSVFKKNLTPTSEFLKVAQLSGYVAEKSLYHHGEQNLPSVITNLAQNFVGSNNIPLLDREGQFGTRLEGGKDAANGRYIFTRMDALTRLLFPQADECILNFKLDEGEMIEPEYYIGILPNILINGCTVGIGTGWSCNVPNYNPLTLIDWIESYLSGEEPPTLKPWYRDFKGKIELKEGSGEYESIGIFEEKEREGRSKGKEIHVTELPIKMWTNKYKDFLEGLVESKKIKDFDNYCDDEVVKFVIKPHPSSKFKFNYDTLRLKTNLKTTNMVLFCDSCANSKAQSIPHHFKDVEEIMECYSEKRIELYDKRRLHQIKELEEMTLLLTEKRRFITQVISDEIKVFSQSRKNVESTIIKNKYQKVDNSYSYLLDLKIHQFTQDKIDELDNEINKNKNEIQQLSSFTPKDMWLSELSIFKKEYNKIYEHSE